MTYTVYVLYSNNYNKHYTGYTSDIKVRLQSHNNFGAGWTSKYRPWELIFSKEFTFKPDAIRYEKWLRLGLEEIL